MKTAACWIGNEWRIVTTALGDSREITLTINVDEIASGHIDLPFVVSEANPDSHYTILEVTKHNRRLWGRTIGKTKEYLRSIYRQDISAGQLLLTYNDEPLRWERYKDDEFLALADGSVYRKDFIFEIEGKDRVADGWVGVLRKGSRSKAGFSILHRKRVIKGWPDSWRPEKIYGLGGRNDLINQRLVGEVNLEDFEVSHTKDEINWHGDEEERVEEALLEECKTYIETARTARKGQAQGHGPKNVDVDAAVQSLEAELSTTELLEKLSLEEALPTQEQILAANTQVADNAAAQDPTVRIKLGELVVSVFLDTVGSPNDPYFIVQDKGKDEVLLIVNLLHPHWSMLEGENSVLNYLRHCVYDGVAEHRARGRARLEPETIKTLKDGYLRVAFDVLQSGD